MTPLELLQQLHWARPLWLLAIPLIIALAVFVKGRTLRAGDWAEHIDSHLLNYLALHESEQSTRFGTARLRIVMWISLIITALALAGPAWNKSEQPPLKNTARTIIIADMTMSMFATDTQPSRLVQLKFKIRELLKSIPDGESALIAYSGDAHIVSPLTDDFRAIDNLVPALSPEIFPSIGSNPESAFELLTDLLEGQPAGYNSVILFTDEILPASQRRILQSIRNKDIDQFVVVGVGTSQGSPIPLPSGRFLKDSKGNIVSTAVNRSALSAFSQQAGASYLELSSDNNDIKQLTSLLSVSSAGASHAHLLRDTNDDSLTIDHWEDRGGWLALAIIPFTLCLFRKGFLFSLLIVFSTTVFQPTSLRAQESSAEASPLANINNATTSGSFKDSIWQRAWLNRDQRGQRALTSSEAGTAVELFNDPEWLAAAQSLHGDYSAAEKTYSDLASSTSLENIKKSQLLYNQAYNLAHAGKLQAASNTFAEAIELKEDFNEAEKAKKIVDQLLAAQQQNQQQQNADGSENNDEDSSQGDQSNSSANNESGQGQNQQSQSSQGQQEQGEQESGGKDQASSQDSQKEASPNGNQNQDNGTNTSETTQQQSLAQEGKEDEQASDAGEQKTVSSGENQENSEDAQAPALSSYEKLSAGEKAKLESWLNKLTDDPGGLLRRKFDYERQLREREGTVIVENENDQLW